MKRYLVDTLATIFFFTTLAALAELYVAGMAPLQVLTARAIMIPVMMLTGRPYGLWRDWVFLQCAPSKRLSLFVCDVLAFLTFQVPVYVCTLLVADADGSEVMSAVAASIVFMILLSRPFGLYLDVLRRLTGVAVTD